MSILFLTGVAWVLGTWVFRGLRLDSTRGTWVLRFLVGFCLCAMLVLILGSASLWAARFALYVLAVLGLGYEFIIRPTPPHVTAWSLRLRPFDMACVAALAVGLLLALVSALAPVTDWQALTVYLPLASEHASAGRIAPVAGDPLSVWATPVLTLYAYGFFDGGEFAVRLLSWGFGALACGAVLGLARRTGGPRIGVAAAAILATTPAFYAGAGTVSTDLAVAGLAVGALWAGVAWRQDGALGWLVVAGWLAGTAAAARLVGVAVVALLAVGLLLASRPHRVRSLGVFALAAGLALLPWWLYGCAASGHLVWPGRPYVESPADLFAFAPKPYGQEAGGLVRFLTFPWDIVMRPYWFDGWTHSPGGLVLFLGLPGLLVGGPWARRLGAFSLLGGLGFYFVYRSAQAYLPLFLPMMVVAALAAVRLTAWRRIILGLLIVHFAYGIALQMLQTSEVAPVLFGSESRDVYLARRLPYHAAYAWLDAHAKPDAAVLTLEPRIYGLKLPAYRDYESVAALKGQTRAERVAWLRAHHIRYLFYPSAALAAFPGYRHSKLYRSLEEWRAEPRMFWLVHSFRVRRGDEEEDAGVKIYERAWN